ncbi:hypothetical protein Syun_004215 [Stephania yunnanensis]|uniref:Uncharacterized protein n=1 Tax=Stephania yunnanensis TaxID=152371 RepID=A0AAP0Q0Z6_9MAGN
MLTHSYYGHSIELYFQIELSSLTKIQQNLDETTSIRRYEYPSTSKGKEVHLLDWLSIFFGFQRDNVRNQWEHLILHLANDQMCLKTPPDPIDSLNPSVLRRFRRGLLSNYSSWCSYLGQKSKIWLPEPNPRSADLRRELLYAALYLLI